MIDQIFSKNHTYSELDDGTKIQAEVGFKHSNVQIIGWENYEDESFGAKLMIRGEPEIDGSFMKVSNIEMTKCGQIYTGQHCIEVWLEGLSEGSFIKSSAIYETFARPLNVPTEVSKFLVENNFFHHGTGHNIFFEHVMSSSDINRNLIMSPMRSHSLFQSDIYPSAIRVRGTLNKIFGNHIAGCISYGIYFDISSSYGSYYPYTMRLNAENGENVLHGIQNQAVYLYRYFAN